MRRFRLVSCVHIVHLSFLYEKYKIVVLLLKMYKNVNVKMYTDTLGL